MIGTIIKRVFVQDLRNRSNYVYFLILPVSLMVILGLVLQGTFATQLDSKVAHVHVQYVVDHSQQAQLFDKMVKHADITHLDFKSQRDLAQAKNVVRTQSNTALVQFGTTVTVQTAKGLNDYQTILLKSSLAAIFRQMGLVQTAIHYRGRLATVSTKKLVKINHVQAHQSATSFQYYALAMMGMFMLYFSEIGLDMFGKARRQKTLARELLTPVTRGKLLNATVGGHLLFGLLVIGVLMGITAGLFKMPWSRALGFTLINFSGLMALFLIVGLLMDTINSQVGSGIVQIVIQLVAFLGGGYFPTSSTMMQFSPLGWIMGPMRSALWTTNSLDWSGAALNFGLAFGLLIIVNWIIRRREVF